MQQRLVRFYIGTETNRGGLHLTQWYREHALKETERVAAEVFGGYTIIEGKGGWLGPDGKLVREKSIIVEIAMDMDDPEGKADKLEKFLRAMMEAWDQEAILVLESQPMESMMFTRDDIGRDTVDAKYDNPIWDGKQAGGGTFERGE